MSSNENNNNSANVQSARNATNSTVTNRRKALFLLGWICWFAGMYLVGNVHTFQRRTYVSENALLITGTSASYGIDNQKAATIYSEKFYKERAKNPNLFDPYLIQEFKNLGFDTQEYQFGDSNSSNVIVAVWRTSRGSGTESIVFSTVYDRADEKYSTGQVTALGFTTSLMLCWKQAKWLAKDLIFIFVKPQGQASAGIAGFLAFHLQHRHSGQRKAGAYNIPAGAIQGAFHIDFPSTLTFTKVHVSIIGEGGQLPNLDLLNTFQRWAQHHGIYSHQLDYDTTLPPPLPPSPTPSSSTFPPPP